MGDCIDFGIISNIEYDKDYSKIGSPTAYKALYTQYNCVSVPDKIVNAWIPLANNIPTYLCSLSRKNMGIDHYGVTIIPPESAKMLFDIVRSYMIITKNESVEKLVELLNKAIAKREYVICYGI